MRSMPIVESTPNGENPRALYRRTQRPVPQPTSKNCAPGEISAIARARLRARNCKSSMTWLNHAGARACKMGANPEASTESKPVAKFAQYSLGEYIFSVAHEAQSF